MIRDPYFVANIYNTSQTHFVRISGAFVAGLDAGLVYSSFPKMGDHWLPEDILSFSPTLRNFTENPSTVQFDHRVLGSCTLAAASALWLLSRRAPLSPAARRAANAVGAMAWLQVHKAHIYVTSNTYVLKLVLSYGKLYYRAR